MPTPREELEQLRALAVQEQSTAQITPAVQQPQAIMAPRQELEELRSLAQPQPKPEGTGLDVIVEPAQAIVSSLAGTIGAGIGGAAIAPFVGAQEAGKFIEKTQQKAAELGAPETQRGAAALETVGSLIEKGVDIARFPLSGLAGIAELISGQGIEQAAQTVKSVQEKGLGPTAGERAFEITGDPLIATVAFTSPEIVGSLIPVTKMVKTRSALKTKIADQIKSGATDKTLARYMVTGSGKLKGDTVAKETIKQGFDQGVIAAVKGSSKLDRTKMAKMVEVMEKGKGNALFALKNRPSDIAGDSLLKRVQFIKKTNRDAGNKINIAAKSLKGQKVDFKKPIDNFMESLDEMGIGLSKDLKPIFRGSDIEGLAGPESAIKNIIQRLSKVRRGTSPDAFDLHRMKRFIDENVTYGKAGEGLKGKTERVLKRLRADLDETLDSNFPNYNEANTIYSDTVRSLDALQDVAGKKMDLFGPNADKAVGTLLRRMLSNAQSRVNLVDAVDDLGVISKKYGANFGDDISTQMLFVDELDSVFGPVARTSLAGETAKGIKKGAEAVTGQRTVTGAAIEAVAAGAEKLRGISQENAFKSIKELLERQ